MGHLLPPLQTGALFFVLAFGMISRWRAGMYFKYRRLMAGEIAADAALAEQAPGD